MRYSKVGWAKAQSAVPTVSPVNSSGGHASLCPPGQSEKGPFSFGRRQRYRFSAVFTTLFSRRNPDHPISSR